MTLPGHAEIVIVGGEPSTDLWDVDIRRFGSFTGKGAEFGSKNGWERASYFKPPLSPSPAGGGRGWGQAAPEPAPFPTFPQGGKAQLRLDLAAY